MGYAESNGGPYQRIDTSPAIVRPQTRYGGLDGLGHPSFIDARFGLGALGESDINQYNALVTSTTSAVNAAKSALTALDQEVKVASITPGIDTSGLAVISAGIADAAGQPNAILAEIAAKGPGKFGKNDCGPNYCTQPLAAIKQIAPNAERLTNTVATLRAQFNAWKSSVLGAAKAAQDAAAAAQAAQAANMARGQQDTATVNGALTKATAFMGQGNYAGALAVLQSQGVIDAASRIGRASDLDTASAAIAYQQNQVNQQQSALQQQQAQCAAKGGQWNGTYCDMSAVQTAQQKAAVDAANAKVDAAIGQSAALAAAKNYRGALLVLSGAMGPAASTGRSTDVQLAMADVQQQQADDAAAARAAQESAAAAARDAQNAAAQAAQLARVGARVDAAITQANTYAADGAFDVALSVLNSAMADAASINRAADVTSTQTAIQQARKAALAPKPADMSSSVPGAAPAGPDPGMQAILMQILAALQGRGGGGGGEMASSIPGVPGGMSTGGQIQGPPSTFSANTGNYADFGPETF